MSILKKIMLVLALLSINTNLYASIIEEWESEISKKYEIRNGCIKKIIARLIPSYETSTILKKIEVSKFANQGEGPLSIFIEFRASYYLIPEYNNHINQFLSDVCESYTIKYAECSNSRNFKPLLRFFYEQKIIPEAVLSMLIFKTNIEDFRETIKVAW